MISPHGNSDLGLPASLQNRLWPQGGPPLTAATSAPPAPMQQQGCLFSHDFNALTLVYHFKSSYTSRLLRGAHSTRLVCDFFSHLVEDASCLKDVNCLLQILPADGLATAKVPSALAGSEFG